MTVLTAGSDLATGYLTQRIFDGESAVESRGKVLLWRLPELLDRLQSCADLSVLCLDRHSAGLFFNQGWLRAPSWIASEMIVPADTQDLVRASGNAAEEWRAANKKGYTSTISREDSDFELFYDRFYTPYIRKRHGRLARLRSRRVLRRSFKRGLILWIWRDGERQAADIIQIRNKVMHRVVLGVLDGRMDLLRQRVLTAVYIHATRLAMEHGCTHIFLGGTRPSLHDGVFRYKRKWGVTVCENPRAYYDILLRWSRLEGAVADFLSHTSLIHRDHGRLSALWAYPHHLPLTAESLQAKIRAIHTPGLHRLRILLPGEAPAGFLCPPDVRLIQLASVAEDWPAFLQALDECDGSP